MNEKPLLQKYKLCILLCLHKQNTKIHIFTHGLRCLLMLWHEDTQISLRYKIQRILTKSFSKMKFTNSGLTDKTSVWLPTEIEGL